MIRRNPYLPALGIDALEIDLIRFKCQVGMARLRARGMAKVTCVTTLRAWGLNIHRVEAYRAVTG